MILSTLSGEPTVNSTTVLYHWCETALIRAKHDDKASRAQESMKNHTGGVFGAMWNGENDDGLQRRMYGRRVKSAAHKLLSAGAFQHSWTLT